MVTRVRTGLFFFFAMACAVSTNAQSIRPPSSIEILAGHAGFADDATIEHSVFGGAGRIYVTPRISVGPEITYMRGPGDDRDWFFLGNFVYDFRSPGSGRPPLVSPFVIAGGGFSRIAIASELGSTRQARARSRPGQAHASRSPTACM